MASLEIIKGRPLIGKPALQGDHLFSTHALLLAILSKGPSHLENIPDTPCFRALLDTCQQNFNLVKAENNCATFHGESPSSSKPPPVISPATEDNLFSWGGFLAGCGRSAQFQLDDRIISKTAINLFTRLFRCGEFEDLDQTGISIQIIPDLMADIRATDARENYLMKVANLYWGLSSQQKLRFKWAEWGSDYPEKLLPAFGARAEILQSKTGNLNEFQRRLAKQLKQREYSPRIISLPADPSLTGGRVRAPGDMTQAAVFALAATLQPGSELLLHNVSLNPQRSGFFHALKRMGAQINTVVKRDNFGEPCGDIQVKHTELKGRKFDRESLKGITWEIPLLAVAGAFAEGETLIRDIGFLRQHREDLLKHLVQTMKKIGVQVGEIEDGLVIRGKKEYDGADTHAGGHPLMGLAFVILGLKSHGTSRLHDSECLEKYFPNTARNLIDLARSKTQSP